MSKIAQEAHNRKVVVVMALKKRYHRFAKALLFQRGKNQKEKHI